MEGKDGKHDPAVAVPAAESGAQPGHGAPQQPAAVPPAEGGAQAMAAPPAESARWGTRQMGPPAAPGAHPENQQAAQWTAARGDHELPPYVIMGEAPAAAQQQGRRGEKGDSPMEHILEYFNTWSRKAEELASNIWFNRKIPFIFAFACCSGCLTSWVVRSSQHVSSRAEQRKCSASGLRVLCFSGRVLLNCFCFSMTLARTYIFISQL